MDLDMIKKSYSSRISVFLFLLLCLSTVFSIAASAQAVDSISFTKDMVKQGGFVFLPVAGYQLTEGETGSFVTADAAQEGYKITVKPGEAVLIAAKRPVSLKANSFVLSLEYGILDGSAQVAVAALNAPKGVPDGQAGYTQKTAGQSNYPVQRLQVVYSSPDKEILAGAQVSLSSTAEKPAVIVLYSLSIYPFSPEYPVSIETEPPGTFDQPVAGYTTNVNNDKGAVRVDSDGTAFLTSGGGKNAANIGVKAAVSTEKSEDVLLFSRLDARKDAGIGGQTALVITDGNWTTGVFVNNENLYSTLFEKIIAGGNYTPSDKPVYVFAQNGGGVDSSSIRIDNLILQKLPFSSISGLPEDVPFRPQESLAAALMMPKELYGQSLGSFSLTTINNNTHTPVSMPFQVFLTQKDQRVLLGGGITNQNGFLANSFSVPSVTSGIWKVEVLSFGEQILSGETTIKDGGVLFIETDKPIYKPGQLIQGRAVLVNNALQPLQGNVEISITDAKGIKIFKETVKANDFGVASFKLPLASELNYGAWKITAKSGTATQATLDILVDKYVLPSFEVNLNLSKQWYLIDEKITGTVESKFFFGKPVQGTAEIEVFKYVGTWQSFAKTTGRLKDGNFDFTLPAVGYVAATPNSEGNGKIQVKVQVVDDTGHAEKTDALVTIVSSGLQLKIIPETPVIKPGLDEELLITSESPEGAPLSAAVHLTVSFMAEDGSDRGKIDDKIKTENGLALYNLTVPEKTHIAFITLEGELDGKQASASLVQNAVYSPGAHFIHLRQKQQGILPVGSTGLFDVFATAKGTVYYEVVANGRTLFTDTVSANFISLPVSPAMSPKAKLVAYMIQPDNEVSVDVLPFDVQLQSSVSLKTNFSAEEVKPGDPVSLTIQGEGESMVGISIVDESVYALAKGRLNLQNVFAELEKIFMEPQSETHVNPDPWSPQIDVNAKGAMDLLLENNLLMIYSKPLSVPKAKTIDDPWKFWGRMPGRFQQFFPVPAAEDGWINKTGGAGYQEPDRVRTFFPETWLWQPDLKTDVLGRATLNLTAPDNITTWKLHAVSTSQKGMGITESSLRVFQDFFADPDLPYSVIRGDQFPLKVRLYNYVDEPQHIKVTLDKSDGLGLLDNPVQEIDLPANGIASVTFTLQPDKVGLLPVSIVAQSAKRADAIRKDLRVEPEGTRRTVIANGLLKENEEVIFDATYPENLIADSEKLVVNITPSLLGQTINGLDDLLGMPYGCGEQNMIFFAPDVEILRYLKSTGQLMPAIMAKAETFITTGYQRELTFRHSDGSFSAFGEQDESGSLWLTSFVLSTLSNARDLQTIDDTILSDAVKWILSHQAKDGSWSPVGQVIHQEMIGGVQGTLGISAFVTVSLIDYGQTDSANLNKALDYLAANITNEKVDPYVLTLITYALTKANHPQAPVAVDLLLKNAKSDGQGMYWEPHPVESTGYALMALLASERVEAQAAVEWLSLQRNGLGGFHSTQDTVVGLKALTMAALTQGRNLDANIDVIADGKSVHTFTVNSDNFDVLQSLEMESAQKIQLKMTGKGKVYYQFAQSFNVPAEKSVSVTQELQLKVNYAADHIQTDDLVDVNVSVLYAGEEKTTGMSIVDISIPTGFAVVQETLDKLQKSSKNFKRIDVAGRKVVFYLDHFDSGEAIEFSFQVRALFPVKADTGTSSAYLYYDTQTRAEAPGKQIIVK